MVHTFNSSIVEAEAGGSLWLWGQLELHSETLIQKTKKKVFKNECLFNDFKI